MIGKKKLQNAVTLLKEKYLQWQEKKQTDRKRQLTTHYSYYINRDIERRLKEEQDDWK